MPERASAWATRQVYLAHFTVTDVAGETLPLLRALEPGRGRPRGRAGRAVPRLGEGLVRRGRGAVSPDAARGAAEGDAAIDLVLQPGKPPVLQGEQGLSRKSAEPGNASYYYSLTRMPASGTVRLGGESFAVTGLAWMDREWSTSSLGKDQVGWDWFALQLSDGWDLMLYRLRRADGTADPASSGTVIAPDGGSRPLSLADFRFEALGQAGAARGAAPVSLPLAAAHPLRGAGPRGPRPCSPIRSSTSPSATGRERWRSRAPAAAGRSGTGVRGDDGIRRAAPVRTPAAARVGRVCERNLHARTPHPGRGPPRGSGECLLILFPAVGTRHGFSRAREMIRQFTQGDSR